MNTSKGVQCSNLLLLTAFSGWLVLCVVVSKGVFQNYMVEPQSPTMFNQPGIGRLPAMASGQQYVLTQDGQYALIDPSSMAVVPQQRSRKELYEPFGAELAAVADSARGLIGTSKVAAAEVASLGGDDKGADKAGKSDAEVAKPAEVAKATEAEKSGGGKESAEVDKSGEVKEPAEVKEIAEVAKPAEVAKVEEAAAEEAESAEEAEGAKVAGRDEVEGGEEEMDMVAHDWWVREGLVAGLQHHVCGLGKPELKEALGKSHGKKVGTDRYYFVERWMTLAEFQWQARQKGRRAVVCVIVHVKDQMPCKGGDCVLHFYLRPHDTDLEALAQLVEKVEMDGLNENAGFQAILDGGGDCGMAAVLFATMYPNARIVTVEPALSSYEVLRMNIEQFPNVIPIRAGLWNRMTTLGLWETDEAERHVMEARIGKKNKGVLETFDGVTVPFLLHISGLNSFDFVRLSIEGAEKELFEKRDSNDQSYLGSVRVAMIKVRDDLRQGAVGAVRLAFSEGFRESQTGEYTTYTRE